MKEKRLLRQNAVSPTKTNDKDANSPPIADATYKTTTLTEMPYITLKGDSTAPGGSLSSPGTADSDKSDSHPLLNETRT